MLIEGAEYLEKGYGVVHDLLILVVVKIMVPLWIPIILRHLIFRVPTKEP